MAKIEINRGDSRNIDVTFYQSDGTTPIDLTSGTVFFTVNSSREPDDDTAAAIEKDVTVHTAPLLGQTRIALTSTDTDIDPGTYYYDVQLKDSANNVISSRADRFIVVGDISRRTS